MAELGSVKDGMIGGVQGDPLLKLSPHAHYVRMDDQIVVADMRSGHYVGLDGVGARVWDLIAQRTTRLEILNCIQREYEVSRDTLERDVDLLLEGLLRRKLIEREKTVCASNGDVLEMQ